jgi:hypothetical protein
MTTTVAPVVAHWSDQLRRLNACHDAVEYAEKFPDFAAAWQACERGDWMLWLAGRVLGGAPESPERKRIVAAAVACARLVLPIYEARYPTDKRVRECLDTTERWTRGEATLDELRKARAAAVAAASSAAASSAADADDADDAYAAADAADAAASAADAAASADAADAAYAAAYADDADDAYAAYAAYAAAYASSAAATADDAYAAYAAAYAGRQMQRACADIARQHFTAPEIETALTEATP